VSEYPLDGLTAQDAQQLLGDEDIDRVMCLGHAVSGPALAAITAGRAITIDEAGYKYVLSPWADEGYRTPRGYFPPPG
jgi:predicted ribonuclease YlaK